VKHNIYEVYQDDQLISSGHTSKIANETGMSESTIFNYCDSDKSYKGWVIKKKTRSYDYHQVDYEKIKSNMKEFGLKHRDLAEVLDVATITLSKKMQQISRFKNTEIELLEDLFFLDEGELIKEELTNRTHPPDGNIQTFPKSSERIARMIREEDEISD